MITKQNLASADHLVNAYEELREQALHELKQTQGLVLFLSRGLTAWSHAWSQCFSPQIQRDRSESFKIPVQAEVAQLLANMVLCHGGLL